MRQHITILSRLAYQKNSAKSLQLTRFLSTQEAIDRRNHLFTLEKKRQHENVGRIEKIEVNYKGIPNDCVLVMNKDISTPYDCARHLSEWHTDTSALALLNGSVYWDMHRPLTENCTLELQTFEVKEPQAVNKAFWRTCSLLLGACATNAFRDNVEVRLHSFPGPDIRSGSFVYDIDLPTLPDWTPTEQEMFTLSAEFVKFVRQNLAIERLEVNQELAQEMFVENQHKTQQIPSIARDNGKVTLYRVGKHVDISKGPMISNTAQVGRVAVTAVHKLTAPEGSRVKQLYRFQGIALPNGVVLNHFAFSILTERAKKLNSKWTPFNIDRDDTRESAAVTA
ncbi:large ribosomal subunit protein mL39 [Plodia interpunctella]|uniref:large ribosomal subunit protein mL39 n=1 Tax=Plodia interpunctella TaxID=58824 RepID=UPI002367EEBA|nr:39S ribosomal protein L39, mitochondrial [Plodia interpunctella]